MVKQEIVDPKKPFGNIVNDIMSDDPLTVESKEILDRAIQKAVDNGWDTQGLHLTYNIDHQMPLYRVGIFDHGFAKALWGEETWKHHMQQMVIDEHPLAYLDENI